MAREYSIVMTQTTVSAARTLIFINNGTATAIEILRMWVSQDGTATSQQERVQVVTQVTAFPTLTTYTPRAIKGSGEPASKIAGGTAGAAGTCGINASAEGAGAKTVMWEFGFNNLNGWEWLGGPYDTLMLPPGGSSGIGIYLPDTPATTAGWNAGLIYRELS